MDTIFGARPDRAQWTLVKHLNSMRLRLSLLFSAIIIFLLFISFAFLYYFLHKNFKNEAVTVVDERILLISDLLNDYSNGLNILKNRIENEWIGSREPLSLQVQLPGGFLFAESPQYSQKTGEEYFQAERIIKIDPKKFSVPYLKISLKFDRAKERELLISYGQKMILLFVLAIFFSSYITFTVISRELFPLLKMSRKMKHISLRSLHRRIDFHTFPIELVPVAQSFNMMLNELENSFEQISRFSSDIAHELRTPLNALMIKIQVMMEKPRTTEEYQELLESLNKDTRGLSKLIDTLLFLSRAENPNIVLQFENLNLNDEIQSLIDFYEALASEKNIRLEFQAHSAVSINAEKSLFYRAIGNLLQNAIQHCPVGSLVTVRLVGGADGALIEVSDNGPGIDSIHIPHIFDRLYRIDASRNSHSGGLGLGLSIVASIMKLHGGSVSVQSELGEGCLFQLNFPNQKRPPNQRRR
ncbi:MAG: heavy metal sensor histidine kinase [Pseudobdellovibrionaceae bacterium]